MQMVMLHHEYLQLKRLDDAKLGPDPNAFLIARRRAG